MSETFDLAGARARAAEAQRVYAFKGWMADEIKDLAALLAGACDEIEEWRNYRAGCLNPAEDEVHCACVPGLHREIDKLRADLEQQDCQFAGIMQKAESEAMAMLTELRALREAAEKSNHAMGKAVDVLFSIVNTKSAADYQLRLAEAACTELFDALSALRQARGDAGGGE